MIATRIETRTQQDIQQLDLNLIELSGGTQSRAGFDEATLAEYVSAWERGVQFPPIEVYFDGEYYWLSDGFHRVVSRKRAKVPNSTIAAVIHQGARRDAVLASVGTNATHGLKRTNADKRRAVMTLLRDPEWATWANTAIAEACGVDETLVRTVKSELSSVKPKMADEALAKKNGVDVGTVLEAKSQVSSLPEKRTARRNGRSYTVKTSQIGKSRKALHCQSEGQDSISSGIYKDAPANADQPEEELLEKEASVISVDQEEHYTDERSFGSSPLGLDQICIMFCEKVGYFSHEQIEEVWKAIAPHVSEDSLMQEIELRHH